MNVVEVGVTDEERRVAMLRHLVSKGAEAASLTLMKYGLGRTLVRLHREAWPTIPTDLRRRFLDRVAIAPGRLEINGATAVRKTLLRSVLNLGPIITDPADGP